MIGTMNIKKYIEVIQVAKDKNLLESGQGLSKLKCPNFLIPLLNFSVA